MVQSRVDRQQTYHCKTGGGAPGYPPDRGRRPLPFLARLPGVAWDQWQRGAARHGMGLPPVRSAGGLEDGHRPDILFPHAQLAPDAAVEALPRHSLGVPVAPSRWTALPPLSWPSRTVRRLKGAKLKMMGRTHGPLTPGQAGPRPPQAPAVAWRRAVGVLPKGKRKAP